ncbi:type I phosphomannose isomerase catalytic subunit [Botrimarina mediterranea]|uniref:Putative mannose-6-phosphate isomerase GmuF n=1 Tax=Botrimarina mediterranea TaxID=2528022 RepID=A0A518KAW4_9BACT|nr:type I phosphomannose isomerase catalytic subunit [Botrimarina mediterranea]QDV74934.1 putative mannose-6-phosphate isomerase GmuF [Botrimarina mediterranea]QDV79579.1 putative mannose-6-phosphate isomerase GmuF [Planctomycetes bacterium K2D]
MSCNYPLRLRPILQEYLWGGRRLGELLGKSIGDGPTYAESWEVVDHPDGQSVVENGPLEGKTLGEISKEFPADLYGPITPPERFPLLFKYLDAQKTLSVQVHPNDAQAAKQSPPDLGKTEAWLVIAAEPGGKIYSGLKPGVDRETLAAAIEAGECDKCLYSFEPRPGECVFIPAGTVHALGAGLVIAEIQQASNTTFRLFDWNRVDKDGKPRPLHIEESLAVTDYERGPVGAQKPQACDLRWERLVTSDKFLFSRLRTGSDESLALPNCESFHIVSLVEGSGRLTGEGFDEQLAPGQTLLVPAACPKATFVASEPSTLLDMRLPS